MGEDVSSMCPGFGCTDGQREAGVGGAHGFFGILVACGNALKWSRSWECSLVIRSIGGLGRVAANSFIMHVNKVKSSSKLSLLALALAQALGKGEEVKRGEC